MKRLFLVLALVGGLAEGAFAQSLKQGQITTSGADCSTATACLVIAPNNLFGIEAFTVYTDVGTSGTFEFEATQNGVTWYGVEDMEGDTSVTSDDANSFTNLGWLSFRVRASAISGTASLWIVRGFSAGGGGSAASSGEVTVSGTISADIVAVNGVEPLDAANTGSLQTNATANGDGSTLTTNGYGTVVLTVNCASCSGGTLINFEGTEDGTNYVAITAQRLGSVNTIATGTTTAGLTYWQLPVVGLQNVRARISAYSAGTVDITGRAILYAPGVLPELNDPCKTGVKTTTSFSYAADDILVAGVASKSISVCQLTFVVSAAEIVSFTEGTGAACGTSEAARFGNDGTTDANGMSFAANSGLNLGNGSSSVISAGTAGEGLCIILGGTNRVSGAITWVQQ